MKFYLLLFVLLFIPFFVFAEEKTGPLVLVGGGPVPQEAIDWMKGKSKTKKYIVVTLNKEKCQQWKDFFGDPEILFPEDLKIEHLNGLGGIVIDGGDQWIYVNKLDGKIITEANKQGIPILGTSAGSMILGEYYFSAEEDTISSEEALAGKRVCIRKNFVEIEKLKKTFIESHYTERNRQMRLKVFMQKSGAEIGFGIDEATALCIDEDGKHTTFGEGTVAVVSN